MYCFNCLAYQVVVYFCFSVEPYVVLFHTGVLVGFNVVDVHMVAFS